jgi:hypothetical protein
MLVLLLSTGSVNVDPLLLHYGLYVRTQEVQWGVINLNFEDFSCLQLCGSCQVFLCGDGGGVKTEEDRGGQRGEPKICMLST